MIFEAAGGLSSCQIPQAEGLVPRAGQSVVAVGRKHNITDEVGVAIQALLWDSVGRILWGKLPHDQSLVCWKYGTIKLCASVLRLCH